jgi:hypothetical protein
MSINKIVLSFLASGLLFFGACKNSAEEQAKTVTTDAVNITATASDHKVEPGSQPQFTFAEDSHDFGKITQGEKVSYSFKFKNTGGSDLVIAEAHGSCGCTVPQYPRGPIPAGVEGVIDVTFDSDGKSGKVEKTVTLTANTSPNTKVLKIIVQVEVPEGK